MTRKLSMSMFATVADYEAAMAKQDNEDQQSSAKDALPDGARERERFERHYSAFSTARDHLNQYTPGLQMRWEGWQAALLTRQAAPEEKKE